MVFVDAFLRHVKIMTNKTGFPMNLRDKEARKKSKEEEEEGIRSWRRRVEMEKLRAAAIKS